MTTRSPASPSEKRSSRSSPTRRAVAGSRPYRALIRAEVLAAGEQLVDGGALARQPHRPAHRVGLAEHVVPGHPRGAAGGPAEGGHHPHRGRLAGSVGPEQAEHRALRDHEADVVDGDRVVEVLDEIDGLDGRTRIHAFTLKGGSDRAPAVATPRRGDSLRSGRRLRTCRDRCWGHRYVGSRTASCSWATGPSSTTTGWRASGTRCSCAARSRTPRSARSTRPRPSRPRACWPSTPPRTWGPAA